MVKAAAEFDLSGFLPYKFTVAAERLSAALAARYQSRFGITVPEWRTLVHLVQADGISVRDIEKRANLEKSKVSRAVSRLVAKGFMAKTVNPDDRRLINLTLTPQGHTLMQELLPIAQAFQQELEQCLSGHLTTLNTALAIICEKSK